MRVFKAIVERRDVEKKYLPMIYAELVKINERGAQQGHEISGANRDIHRDLQALAADTKNFIEVIRHFFANELALRTEEAKRKAKEAEDIKPGKHDDLF